MPPYSLANFEIQKKYQMNLNFRNNLFNMFIQGAYWRNNLSKISGGLYLINLDEH